MIELDPGQELVLTADDGTPHTRLRVGLGWDKEPTAGFIGTGAPEVDLDASAVQFAGQELFDLAFYNNAATRDGSVTHLGDNRSGQGEGDDESLTIDLGRVYPRVDTIALIVTSYQGHSLEWINRAYCRLVDEGSDDSGGSGTEFAQIHLTGGVPETGLVVATLVRTPEHWTLRAIGEGIAVTVPTQSVEALRRFL